MSVSYWLDQSAKIAVKNKDVVIVGAGLAGLSTAYWLSKEDPTLKIVVIDRAGLGAGASGRNAGFVTCGSVEHFNRLCEKHGEKTAQEMWAFSETNKAWLKEEIIQGEGSSIGFEEKGSFSLASTESEMRELKKSALTMEKMGIAVEMVDEAQIKKRLQAEHFVGGIKYIDDGSVHPILLLQLMKKRIEALNPHVEFLFHSEVHAMESVQGEKLVRTKEQTFLAPMVVLGTNGYSPAVHSYFNDKIFPTRGQILITEKVAPFMEGPCYANFVLDYFRQLPTGELLIGGFRQLEKETEVGYSDHTTDKIQQALLDFIQHHLPQARGKKITHRWAGIMGFSVDGQPMVGSLPTDQQVFFVGGFTGHGLGLSFHSAKCLADVIYGREIPAWISAKRFH